MPPLAASEAKSLTVGKRQGHRPAFHQNNPNILVKIETDSSMSPVNVLEGNFGLTAPLINWPVLSLESLQVAVTRSGLCVLRTMQLLQRRRHRAGWKFCGSRGWIYSEDVHWWNSTKGDQHFLTDITLGLQNPRAATTSWTDVQLGLPVSWPGAVQGQPSTVPVWPWQTPPGHAARGDKAALPRRGAWQWVATRDPGWWPCNRIT